MQVTRTRYQSGSLTTEKRKTGPDVWVFLYRETDSQGKRRLRKTILGTVKEYRSESAAAKAVALLRAEINSKTESGSFRPLSVAQLISHYEANELDGERSRKANSTRKIYKSVLAIWIKPFWGDRLLSDVKAVAVEEWLSGLKLAAATKAKIRNIMSALFAHARRYEFTDRDPIREVRQSAKRETIPDVLTVEELTALLPQLQQPYLSMVVLAAVTGLRRSELFALKWADVAFDAREIRLSRAIVHQVVGEMKTEASRKPVSLEPGLAGLLADWKAQTKYSGPDDWVFASPESDGAKPYWPDTLLTRHIKPAVERAGIKKLVGWHTFRHTLATVLKANGEDVKTTQEILRHANSRITMDIYAQAVTPAKRQAQAKVLEMILPEGKRTKKAAAGS
jgi:integrase